MAKKSVPINDEPVPSSSRQVALDRALGDITKRYGDMSIMRLG